MGTKSSAAVAPLTIGPLQRRCLASAMKKKKRTEAGSAIHANAVEARFSAFYACRPVTVNARALPSVPNFLALGVLRGFREANLP